MPDDTCFSCGTAIPPKPAFVPWCVPCALASFEDYRQRCLWTKRLSAMGAMPRKKTKRAERLRAVREMGVKPANDNGTKFGEERRSRDPRRRPSR